MGVTFFIVVDIMSNSKIFISKKLLIDELSGIELKFLLRFFLSDDLN